MEFPELALPVLAHVVIDAIGDVACLLYLCYFHAGPDAVHSSGGDVETVAWHYVGLAQVALDASVGNLVGIVVHIHSLLEACYQLASTVGLHYIPHLVFPHLPVSRLAQRIARVYLYGEVLPGVDKLDEQREIGACVSQYGLAQKLLAVALYHLRQCHAAVFTVDYH